MPTPLVKHERGYDQQHSSSVSVCVFVDTKDRGGSILWTNFLAFEELPGSQKALLVLEKVHRSEKTIHQRTQCNPTFFKKTCKSTTIDEAMQTNSLRESAPKISTYVPPAAFLPRWRRQGHSPPWSWHRWWGCTDGRVAARTTWAARKPSAQFLSLGALCEVSTGWDFWRLWICFRKCEFYFILFYFFDFDEINEWDLKLTSR